MKFDKQIKAKELRSQGKSLDFISKELEVSKSSVSLWVRDIELSDGQKEKLLSNKSNNFVDKFSAQKRLDAMSIRRKWQQEGRNKAKENNLLHSMGCMLFWAEGAKNKNSIIFVNSDANMLRLFVRFLKTLGVVNEDIRISINCFLQNADNINQVHHFWVEQLDIHGCIIKKPTIKITNNAIENHGIVRICVHKTQLAQHIFGAIQEYGSFNNDFCLNNKRTRETHLISTTPTIS